MRGHIRTRRLKDGAATRYDVVFDGPRGLDGRRTQITKTFTTKRDAERALAELVRSVNNGTFQQTRVTVGEYLEDWLRNSKQGLRPSTREAYATHIALYLKPYLGRVRLSELRPEHIEQMYQGIKGGNLDRERPVGPAGMRRIHATLRSALNSAVRRRMIAFNPAVHVELEQPKRVEQRYWEPHHVAKFLSAVRDDPLMPLLH